MGALSAGAQSYPERPIRFIVAYPAEFDAFLRREIGKWAKVIKFTGMRVE